MVFWETDFLVLNGADVTMFFAGLESYSFGSFSLIDTRKIGSGYITPASLLMCCQTGFSTRLAMALLVCVEMLAPVAHCLFCAVISR